MFKMTRQNLIRLLLLGLVGAGIALVITNRDQLKPEALEAWVGSLGVWAPLVFILLYFLAPVFFVPGSVLTLAAGVLFGPVLGALYTLIGAVGGASLSFLVARYIAGDWVEQKAKGVLLQMKKGVEEEGWRFVAFVRLVPLFPFNLLNYALGLTKIPLGTYALTSALFMIPGTAGYVYLGYAGREALLGGENWIQKGLWGLGVFAALVFLPLFVRRLRKGSALNTEK